MWLPKEERQLLAYYYRMTRENKDWHISFPQSIDEILDATGRFPALRSISRKIMRCVSFKTHNVDTLNQCLEKRQCILIAANQRLLKRQLISLIANEPGESISDDIRKLFNLPDVKLTIQGWDLGRKYNSWFIRSGLRFAEYKDHWLWVIIGFGGGILGTLIVNWLSGP